MTDERTAPRVPWARLLLIAGAGTVAGVLLVVLNLRSTEQDLGWFLRVGPQHPSRALIQRELPDLVVGEAGSHDGAQFYAIARSPWDLDEASASLDRPRYRLQHPLFSWLAWLAHPWGGGAGLAWTMIGIGVASTFAGAVALGLLSTTLRGPPWVAALFPLLPGSILSLRITVPDPLATALVLTAIALSLRGRHRWAVAAAIAAVLTKEPMVFVLVGFAIWRRDGRGVALVLGPCVAAGAWWLWLRSHVAEGQGTFIDIGAPFTGFIDSVGHWASGDSPLAMVAVVAAVVLAVVGVVRRGLAHPLTWPMITSLAFMCFLNLDTIGLERGGTRTALPLLCLGIVSLVAPSRAVARSGPPTELAIAGGRR